MLRYGLINTFIGEQEEEDEEEVEEENVDYSEWKEKKGLKFSLNKENE